MADSFAGYMGFTVYVASAFRDANREQRSLLTGTWFRRLKRIRSQDNEESKRAMMEFLVDLNRIMGNWQLKQEYAVVLERLLYDGKTQTPGQDSSG